MPFTWVSVLLILALLFSKARKKLLLICFLMFYLFSNQAVFQFFVKRWEMPLVEPSSLSAQYDAAIILGGFTEYTAPGEPVNFNKGVDRLTSVLPLYNKGIVKHLFFSGGSGSLLDTLISESQLSINYLKSIGYPDSVLWFEEKSRNTYENATFSKLALDNLAPNGKFLLVTSAIHMPRAKACFEKANVHFDVFTTDPLSNTRNKGLDFYLLPNESNFALWNQLINEWFGYLIYKVKGYL